jgi:cell division septum initiation protein DivIVA
MNTKQQAAADLKRMSQMLKGIIAIGDDLEAMGSIEQALAESQSRIIKLQGEELELRQRLVSMEDVLKTSQDALQATIRKSDERAAEIASTAEAGAKRIVSEAVDRAFGIVEAAKQEARGLDADLKDKRALIRTLDVDIRAGQARLDEVNAKLSELRKRL